MELKNQVSNLKLSKRLKELGFDKDCRFYWILAKYLSGKEWVLFADTQTIIPEYKEIIKTYTATELGEFLPESIGKNRLHIGKNESAEMWFCEYGSDELLKQICDESEADCRAKMLIFLIDNDIIKL